MVLLICFPTGGNVHLGSKPQSGSWSDINSAQKEGTITQDVFTLWLDHGVKPTNGSYAYIVVPNVNTAQEISSYASANNIEILVNSQDVQAVKHRGLDMIQLVFSNATTFKYKDMLVEVNQPCAIILKSVSTSEVDLHIADIGQNQTIIDLKVKIPSVSKKVKRLICNFEKTGIYAGQSKKYTINKHTANYEK